MEGIFTTPWFFAGLAFNAFGYLALLLHLKGEADGTEAAPIYRGVVKIPSTAEPAACPACGGLNHPAATDCTSCGTALTPTAESEVALAAAFQSGSSTGSDTSTPSNNANPQGPTP